jgi:predicted amidohydrolase
LTICYDIRFPEIYRAYRKSGADILVNCAAWGSKKPIPWEVMTKSRAVENQCYMIALTQCGYIENCEYNLGESRIIDYKGEELSYIKDIEGISTCTINLSEMYEFRDKCKILNDIKDNYEVKVLCTK